LYSLITIYHDNIAHPLSLHYNQIFNGQKAITEGITVVNGFVVNLASGKTSLKPIYNI